MYKKVLVLNGPNINLTGQREPNKYGNMTLEAINQLLMAYGKSLDVDVDFFQSNHEGELIDRLHDSVGNYCGIVINPGAFTHYSYAIRDAIAAIALPAIEVHMSNVHAREAFRAHSVIAPVCIGQISGLKHNSYIVGLQGLVKYIEEMH